jgi:hypothetical protein
METPWAKACSEHIIDNTVVSRRRFCSFGGEGKFRENVLAVAVYIQSSAFATPPLLRLKSEEDVYDSRTLFVVPLGDGLRYEGE